MGLELGWRIYRILDRGKFDMKIGVLGGTFDPVHNGHLAVAGEVEVKLGLDEVLFVPAAQPQLRTGGPVSAGEHRIRMVRLAINGKPCYRLSLVEIERAGPSYTVDTIAQLRSQIEEGDELFFILGWDNLAELPRWREPTRLISMCRLVAVPRPGGPLPDLNSLEVFIPGLTRNVILLQSPRVDISASEVRRRVAQGLSIRHLVPGPVADYIRDLGLYATIDRVG
ncbi:MAG: nicotinate-nucleotide adenylyltransferase [Dehalococcoidales bacterium]|nr:nicotinate-nucleotide adenylyltransferase [Dehalococcoidales bacterium]